MKDINLSLKALMISTSLLIGVSDTMPVKALDITNESKEAVRCTLIDNDTEKMRDMFSLDKKLSLQIQCQPGNSPCTSTMWGCKLDCSSKNDPAIGGNTVFHCTEQHAAKTCTISDTTEKDEPQLSIRCY